MAKYLVTVTRRSTILEQQTFIVECRNHAYLEKDADAQSIANDDWTEVVRTREAIQLLGARELGK